MPLTRFGARLGPACVAAAVIGGPGAAHAESWWRLGALPNGDALFVDADTIAPRGGDTVFGFRGMFVNALPDPTSGGAPVRYEVFDAEIDCLGKTLTELRSTGYSEARAQLFSVSTQQTYPIHPGQAAEREMLFVCGGASQRTGLGFVAVSDPVQYARGW